MNHLGDTNKMVSDTPRTETYVLNPLPQVVSAEWARQLERELNAANESFKNLNLHALNLTDHIRRLKNAGDDMEKLLPEGCICDKAAIRWIKTKNDKL